MDPFKTPKSKRLRRSLNQTTPGGCIPVEIPASPFMEKMGWGTAVSVYRMERSPKVGCIRSPWAIKRIDNRKSISSKPRQSNCDEIAKRLCKEAEILRTLKHPNIVGFRAFTKSADGRHTLAMEDGQRSLLSVIEERFEETLMNSCELSTPGSNSTETNLIDCPFPAWSVLRVASGICSALAYLHNEAFILHGDIKSDNVLIIGDFDTAKLCDFGVSLKLDQNGEVLDGESYIGTRHWLPPEVLELEMLEYDWEEGDDPIPKLTSQADMYPYALTLWEMLSLKFPHCPTQSSEEEGEEEEKSDDNESLLGTRPSFPSSCLEDSSYNTVIEIIHCCTDEVPKMRPTSKQAVEWLELIEKNGEMKKPNENRENVPLNSNN